jgi:hypothetical protein
MDSSFLKFNVDGAVARSRDKGTIGVMCSYNAGNDDVASAMVISDRVGPPWEALACNEATSLAFDMGAHSA